MPCRLTSPSLKTMSSLSSPVISTRDNGLTSLKCVAARRQDSTTLEVGYSGQYTLHRDARPITKQGPSTSACLQARCNLNLHRPPKAFCRQPGPNCLPADARSTAARSTLSESPSALCRRQVSHSKLSYSLCCAGVHSGTGLGCLAHTLLSVSKPDRHSQAHADACTGSSESQHMPLALTDRA